MKIVLDTNIIFSALFHPSERMSRLFTFVLIEHDVLVFDYVAEELLRTATAIRPGAIDLVYAFLDDTVIYITSTHASNSTPRIRDPKDQPILDASITADADILISGDKDFTSLDIDRPRIMTPTAFFEEFINSH